MADRRRRRARILWHVGGVGVTTILGLVTPSKADLFTVTSAADDGGAGTLRAALTGAAGAPGSSIGFSSALAGQTITLSSFLPVINQNTVIDGAGARLQDGCAGLLTA